MVGYVKNLGTNLYVNQKIIYDKAVDAAVEDGAANLVSRIDGKNPEVDINKALDKFFSTMYLNFNATDDELRQKKISGYVPVLIITDYKGYYVLTHNEYSNSDESKETSLGWSDIKPYSKSIGKYAINFSLDDNWLSVYNNETKTFIEGSYIDIKNNFTESYFVNPEEFEQMRRTSIVNAIKGDISYYINKHNEIARYL